MKPIKLRLVTKLFLFCFLSLNLITGTIGYGAYQYVEQNSVDQFAESMVRSIEMARDSADREVATIRSVSIQTVANQPLKQMLKKIVDLKCSSEEPKSGPLCIELWTNIRATISSYLSSNKTINQMTLVGEIGTDQEFQTFINHIKPEELISDSDLSPIGFLIAAGTDIRIVYSQDNIEIIRKMIQNKAFTQWIDSKICPFFAGWNDVFLMRNSQGMVSNSGYKSPSFTYISKFNSDGQLYMIIIEASTKMFDRIFYTSQSSISEYYIINQNNQFMYHKKEDKIGSPFVFAAAEDHKKSIGYVIDSQNFDEPVLVNYATSNMIPSWKIISTTPLSQIPSADHRMVALIAGLVLIMNAMASLFIAIFAQRVITNPLNRMASTVASFENGSNSIERIQLDTGDELEALSQTINLVADLVDRVNEQSELANANHRQVKYLLDNTGHGIITFGDNYFIHPEFSAEMQNVYLDLAFVGRDFLAITFPDEYTTLRSILDTVFDTTDRRMQETFLSLMPSETCINQSTFQLTYKMIIKYDRPACMIIFSDITEKRALETQLDLETQSVKMIVKVIQNRNEVLFTINAYQRFVMVEIALWLDETRDLKQAYDQLFRQVHTFKGAFAQFHFVYIGHELHRVEEKLSRVIKEGLSRSRLNAIFHPDELLQSLNKDRQIMIDTLGKDFFQSSSVLTIDEQQFDNLQRRVLSCTLPEHQANVACLFREVRYKPFRELLASYPAFVSELADGLSKFIYPLEIIGGEQLVDPTYFNSFTQSLVHVFRNMLDHGIESIDERIEKHKDEYGRITCEIHSVGEGFLLKIADDGRGINREKVFSRAVEKGLCTPSESNHLKIEQIIAFIFEDDFSTKDDVTELSGRGIGMSAVKSEIEKIGGRLSLESEVDKGTTFLFWIPDFQLSAGSE